MIVKAKKSKTKFYIPYNNAKFSKMQILPTIYNSVFSRYNTIVLLVSILATLGTVTVLGAGVWDTISHALRIPDTFWTTPHVVIYTGASIVALSAVLGTMAAIKNKRLDRRILLVLAGAIMQLGGGYVDYNFHEIYGIDGLVTPSHLTVETGLFLSSLGGVLLLAKANHDKLKFIKPISILTVLLAASWVGFNFALLIGGTELCIPIYELFSSGCAVM